MSCVSSSLQRTWRLTSSSRSRLLCVCSLLLLACLLLPASAQPSNHRQRNGSYPLPEIAADSTLQHNSSGNHARANNSLQSHNAPTPARTPPSSSSSRLRSSFPLPPPLPSSPSTSPSSPSVELPPLPTSSQPDHYTHSLFNKSHYHHPAPNRTHHSEHPVPQYWTPDAEFFAQRRVRESHAKGRHRKRAHASSTSSSPSSSAASSALQSQVLIDSSIDEDDPSAPPLVTITNGVLLVNGEPFWIQGVCYSPIPVGESPSFDPKGDYFTREYSYIWLRDLPLIKAMGATTIRIYGWKAHDADHTGFLDAVHAAGLKVLVTFYLGDAKENPVWSQDQRNTIIRNFVNQVDLYRHHPAILMWSFGNELNGSWNGFTEQLSQAFGCWWTKYCVSYTDTNSDCHWQSQCMYYQLFAFIDAAAKAAKMVTTRPIISGFADVDYMVGNTPWLDKVARFDWVVPHLDAWAMQLYRGYTFGGYFWMYRAESSKPMIVTEFGVDAYNDPCGWPENNGGGCFNMPHEGQGGDTAPWGQPFHGCYTGGDCSRPGVDVQREWDMRLAQELMQNYPQKGGVVIGGFLMAWTDEFWKGGGTQDLCAYPCKWWDADACRSPGQIGNYRPGGGALCSYKAHFTCPNWDSAYHDLCGYFLSAAPDNYVNEEWFGLTTPSPCWLAGKYGGQRLDALYVRPAYLGMQLLWSGNQEVDTSGTSCDALWPCWQCTQDHNIDELNDGACAQICELHPLMVGPGSSQHAAQVRQQSTRVLGDSFLARYGLILAFGLLVLGAASFGAYQILRKHRLATASQEAQSEAMEPLLVRQARQIEQRTSYSSTDSTS